MPTRELNSLNTYILLRSALQNISGSPCRPFGRSLGPPSRGNLRISLLFVLHPCIARHDPFRSDSKSVFLTEDSCSNQTPPPRGNHVHGQEIWPILHEKLSRHQTRKACRVGKRKTAEISPVFDSGGDNILVPQKPTATYSSTGKHSFGRTDHPRCPHFSV